MLLLVASGVGCSDGVPAREATVTNAIVQADYPLLIGRPQLVEGKYARMAGNLYSFYRGSFPLYLRDAGDSSLTLAASDFHVPGALPLSLGDAHPENFGLLVASDDTFAIEPNDFDGADRYPYLWEVRRLAVGLCIAARLSNDDDDDARVAAIAAQPNIARAVANGYSTTIAELAAGAEPRRQTEADGNPIAIDLFDRGQGDWGTGEELDELTEVVDGSRRLLRGNIDGDDPDNVYLDVPPLVWERLPAAIERYRQSLLAPPPAAYFTLLDVARELGSGVASYPRVRIILLVRGPSDALDDDVILELKELIDSGTPGWIPPGVPFNTVQERVQQSARQLWARPDAEPLWGVSEFYGFGIQIKQESEGLKTLRTRRFRGAEGTPDAIAGLGALLGGLLARLHGSSGPELTAAIAAVIAGREQAFADEQASAALAYADQVEADWQHFQNALVRLGPRLGVEPKLADRPIPELQQLYGTPPPLP